MKQRLGIAQALLNDPKIIDVYKRQDVLGLYDHLYECENIDELNELGHALLEVRDKGGLQLLCRHGEMYRCPYLDPHQGDVYKRQP